VAQKFHFVILQIEITRPWRGLSDIAELLITHSFGQICSEFP